jgi:methylated-DNA-[protein]-cysteine S-methyltransferase
MTNAWQTAIATPLGEIRLVAQDDALVGVYFPQHKNPAWPVVAVDACHPVLIQAACELAEYFAGERTVFNTPLAPQGTQFQRAVWQALTGIPYGERRSYAWIATAIGHPQACRAVGAANGRNPLSIFVPCHRAVGADGSLTGYAGGVSAKRWLLEHEQAHLPGPGVSGLLSF